MGLPGRVRRTGLWSARRAGLWDARRTGQWDARRTGRWSASVSAVGGTGDRGLRDTDDPVGDAVGE
ncbi:Uncharacterised protein [Mycobacteroides abscessus subsp. abscessus]|nr:Uncharacterised protein [Mycobacteroides abscessus subsp. abscessus]